MNVAFRTGARGFIIKQLQQALGVSADGSYGRQTTAAIAALQKQYGLKLTRSADQQTYRALGLEWPDEFTRCMNLTSVLEGTSFGDCNSTDIDGAGLTLGIAGYTTAHGEVQQILTQFIARRPQPLTAVPLPLRLQLETLLKTTGEPAKWNELFYSSEGKVLPEWQSVFWTWGETPEMQSVQLQLAREQLWQPALRASAQMQLNSARARALLLDIAVQNGGWAARHRRVYDSMAGQSPPRTELQQLETIARTVADCAQAKWQADVLVRKLLFVQGIGTVHGEHFDLRNYGIE